MSQRQLRGELMKLVVDAAISGVSVLSKRGAPLLYGWSHKKRFTLDEMLELLQRQWKTACSADAEMVIKHLVEHCGVVRVNKGTWKIPRLPVAASSPSVVHNVAHVPVRTTYRPGDCLKCGFRVTNPRRHNNQRHTAEDCKLNIVKGVLET